MNIWITRGLVAGAFGAGVWLLGTATSSAATTHQSTQPLVHAAVTAPVTVDHNTVDLLGGHGTHLVSRPAVHHASVRVAVGRTEHHSPARGADAAVHAPVTVRNNSVAVLGRASSAGSNHAGTRHSSGRRSTDDIGVDAPVIVCGNAVGVAGDAHAACPASTHRGGTARHGTAGHGTAHHGAATHRRIRAHVTAPVTVCGNGVGVLGSASASCGSGASGSGSGSASDPSDGSAVFVPVTAPVTVCGNAVGEAGASCGPSSGSSSGSGGGPSGGSGLVDVPVDVPVSVCGNAVGGSASCSVDAAQTGPIGGGHGSTGGSSGGGTTSTGPSAPGSRRPAHHGVTTRSHPTGDTRGGAGGPTLRPASAGEQPLASTGTAVLGLVLLGASLALCGAVMVAGERRARR